MTYSGSPKSYFRHLPALDYPSLANDRNSVYDYQIVKNIFKRAVLRNDIFDEVTAFTKYSVQGDERPDQVANRFYKDSGLDWVVLTTNNIIHVRDEWPMGNQDFLTYLNDKYTAQELSNVHHYETEIIRDSKGRLIQPEGFLDNGVLRSESKVKLFTFLKNEIDLNDAKREINILKERYLALFLEDFGNVMEYKKSSQYVTDSLKKTENPRIISP